MNKYSAYKPSGIEWIGDIPEKWELKPFKYCMTINNGADYKDIEDSDGYPVFGSGGSFAFAKKYMYDGEVVFLGRKGTVDKPLYYEGKFWAIDTMFYAVPQKDVSCKFMYYQALTFPFDYYLTDTARPSMTQTDLGDNKIAVPPKDEQIAIAAYLDAKCAKIDNVISVQQKRIELLKELKQSVITNAVTKGLDKNVEMKSSGIEWIGDIPKNWKIKKLKFISKVNGRVGFKGYTTSDLVGEGEGAFTIGGKHIAMNKLNLSDPEFISWEKYYESPEIMVKKGDILTAQRGSLGKVALVKDEIGEATINPSLVLINNIKCVKEFLYWYMVSQCMQTDIELLNTSTAVPMVSQSQLENIFVPIPSSSEQTAIANYLEDKCATIDSQISKIERQIELLKEFKQSIITECVTGKRKVC